MHYKNTLIIYITYSKYNVWSKKKTIKKHIKIIMSLLQKHGLYYQSTAESMKLDLFRETCD